MTAKPAAASAAMKKKKVSKRNKVAWRKHIDISDVDKFMDEQRQDERVGKFDHKPDAELFQIDRKAAAATSTTALTARQQRKLAAAAPPRCFASLANTSKVADPIVKRNRVRTDTHYAVARAAAAAAPGATANRRQLQSTADQLAAYAAANAAAQQRAAGSAKRAGRFESDVWASGSLRDARGSDFQSPWIEQHVAEHNLAGTGTAIAAVPKSAYHARSQLSALPAPHPGTSYNPSLHDHRELMELVLAGEERIIHKEDHLARVTTAMFDRVTAAQRDRNVRHDFERIAHEPDDESELDSDADNTTGYKAVNAPVVVRRKDARARRKERVQQELRQALAARKAEKKLVSDLHRLRHLQQDVQAKDAQLRVQRAAAQVRKLEKRVAPRRIGRMQFVEEEIDVQMPEQIAGNLRNTKVEGSILASAFKGMQRRNMLAPTVDLGLRRRAEVKRFVRNSHKEEQKPLTKEQWKLNANQKRKA